MSGSDHSSVSRLGYILTWNLPALVIYFTPLNGLYFSPYMSSLHMIVLVRKET